MLTSEYIPEGDLYKVREVGTNNVWSFTDALEAKEFIDFYYDDKILAQLMVNELKYERDLKPVETGLFDWLYPHTID